MDCSYLGARAASKGDRTPHDGVVLSAMLGEEEAVRVGGLLPLATREPGQDDEAEPDRR